MYDSLLQTPIMRIYPLIRQVNCFPDGFLEKDPAFTRLFIVVRQ